MNKENKIKALKHYDFKLDGVPKEIEKMIFEVIDDLEQELSKTSDKLKKIEELFENTIENNKYSYLSKLRDEQCYAIGNNEICRKGLSIIKGDE